MNIGLSFNGVIVKSFFSENSSNFGTIASKLDVNFAPISGLSKYLPSIISKHDVKIIVDHKAYSISPIHNWLKNRKFHLPIYSTKDLNKKELISSLELDVYVDNKLGDLLMLVGIIPKLFFMSDNKTTASNIENVRDWSDIYKIL